MTNNSCPFEAIVGQPRLKKQLNFYRNNYLANNIVPHLLFQSARGMGKTYSAGIFAKSLINPDTNKAKKRIEVNSQSCKSVEFMFEKLFIPHVANGDQRVSFILDECHMLPEPVVGMFLTILNPNKLNKTSYSCGEYSIDFDFSKVTFIFCTSEGHKLFAPFKSRMEVLTMQEYTLAELIEIINIGLDNKFKIEDSIKNDLASVVRGSARDAQKMADKIKNFLISKSADTLTADLWVEFKDALSIMPLGLTSNELEVLEHLANSGNLTLTALSAKTGLTTNALRMDVEHYLLKNSLLKIDVNGRGITAKGLNLLAKTRGAAII